MITGRIRHFFVYEVLHANDPPHRLALGLATGTFAMFSPLFGLQMVINVVLAWVLRANKLVGIPIVWITNPVTIVPVFFPCYVLGCWITGAPIMKGKFASIHQSWKTLADDSSARIGDYFQFVWQQFSEIAVPLCIGCTTVGITLAIVVYYISFALIRKYRASHAS
ncbi:DUF2062 domain-containing protein [Mariniblastus fucicola]|nr:DUF2062 domain-containing protein [Mariniblastus fucicola]